MPTKQETFDTVVRGILAQGRKSADHQGECMYRHELPDGTVLKCAAGMLIPDDTYRPEFEGTVVSSFGYSSWTASALFDKLGHSRSLVIGLQSAHDTSNGDPAFFCHDFIERARWVAKKHELSPCLLDEALEAIRSESLYIQLKTQDANQQET